MTRQCSITGKKPQSGNNVSHANNKTRRKFNPNLQKTSLLSDALGQMVRLRLTTHALRIIEKAGGLDAYLLTAPATSLPPKVARLKKAITGRQVGQQTA
jgi:large subunit ribosomal protein L28